MNKSILFRNLIKNKIYYNNSFFNKQQNNIIYRNFTTNSINDNNNIENKPKIRISKELESLGAYYSNEQEQEFTDEYYDEEEEDYDNQEVNEEEELKKQYNDFQNIKNSQIEAREEQQQQQFGNFEEYLKNGKKFQDMIYRIKDNYEQSQIERKRLLEDMDDFESFEELEKKIEEKMNKKYEEKEKKLSTLTESDFLEYDQSKVDVFNKVSDSFIPAETHFDTPFERTEKQLDSNEIKELPEGIDNMIQNPSLLSFTEEQNSMSNAFQKLGDSSSPSSSSSSSSPFNQKNDIALRISKIKQRISKDKLNVNRIGGEDLNQLFSLYREDPIKNNVESLSTKFNLNPIALNNLLKYTTIPIIVKYNTGLKTGHWNVIFEK